MASDHPSTANTKPCPDPVIISIQNGARRQSLQCLIPSSPMWIEQPLSLGPRFESWRAHQSLGNPRILPLGPEDLWAGPGHCIARAGRPIRGQRVRRAGARQSINKSDAPCLRTFFCVGARYARSFREAPRLNSPCVALSFRQMEA
jgi:hypothetical protein